MNEILFQKNIEKWAETDPKKAYLLPFLTLKKNRFPRETISQAKKWFKSLDLEDTDVLFVYGVGSGNYYLAAKEWLKNKRRLIFLEDDLEVVYRLFQSELGSLILQDKNVSLYYFEDLLQIKETLFALRWEFLMKKIKISVHSDYEKIKDEIYFDLSHRLLNDQTLHNSLVKEYLDYGAAFFLNFYRNIPLLEGSCLGSSFFGKFKNIPAIICGAGPSLNKHLPILKKMQNKALIFAGGSSFNALTAHGIIPHFGAGIDPNSAQVVRIKQTCHVKVPFFFRSRIHHDALKMIEGPKLYIPGSGGYDISEWLEDKLKIPRDQILDEGHNVINFEVEIAHAMGCYPIIFVGMDLSFTGMKSYADGIIDNPSVTKKEILKEKSKKDENDFDLKAVLKKDIYGKSIYTLWKWIVEAEWMGDFAKDHKKALLINATEGGLGFPGIKNETLKSLQRKYFTKEHSLKKRIDALIKKNGMPKITKRKINKLVNDLKSSLERCTVDLDVLLEEIQTMIDKIKPLKKVEKGFNVISGRVALFESDLFEEDGYKYVLDVFSEAFAGVLNHEMREVRLSSFTEKKKVLKKLEINAKRLSFLKTVAEVNLELIRMTR